MDERTKRFLQRGRDHFVTNQYDKAEKALAPLARDRIPFADVYSMLGSINYQKGRLLDALGFFEEALRLNPAYTEAALNLALTYNDLGKYEESKKVYQRMISSRKKEPVGAGSVKVDPFIKGKLANMHADVGMAYEQAGMHDEAAAEYRRALALCPQYVDIRTRLGVALRAVGDTSGAEREFIKAKKEHPNLMSPRLQLGMTYYTAGRRGDAAREWREVLGMEPANKFAKLYLRLITGPEARKSRSGW
jgi:tetratricopeptide (TPR) repeat protein